MRHPSAAAVSVWALFLGLTGCGASHVRQSPAAKLCKPQATRLVAQTLAISPARVTKTPGTGNNGEPQCSFTAQLPGGRQFHVTVNVDPSPQPYTVLARTIEEGQQVFGPRRLVPAPVGVMNLGLLASWFPGPSHLMSTDGIRLVTTTLVWNGVKQGAKIRFATRLSRLYLGRLHPALAHGAPAGG